jgi:hypothetical protein
LYGSCGFLVASLVLFRICVRRHSKGVTAVRKQQRRFITRPIDDIATEYGFCAGLLRPDCFKTDAIPIAILLKSLGFSCRFGRIDLLPHSPPPSSLCSGHGALRDNEISSKSQNYNHLSLLICLPSGGSTGPLRRVKQSAKNFSSNFSWNSYALCGYVGTWISCRAPFILVDRQENQAPVRS